MASIISTLVIAFTGAIYMRGWLHRRSVPAWRLYSFLLGLLATWIAVDSPVAALDSHMLTGHMIQHLLLMTIGPPLIWLGEPLIVAQLSRWRLPKHPANLLGHPASCWLAAAGSLVVWHVPAVLRLGMRSSTWHFVEQVCFLTAGLLFWWPVVQPRPSVSRWPRWSMLLYLFLATLPCDVLSGLLVFSDRVAYPMYLCTPKIDGLSPLADQQCAAALMWTCVTIVFLLAGTILALQMLSPQKEENSR